MHIICADDFQKNRSDEVEYEDEKQDQQDEPHIISPVNMYYGISIYQIPL